VDVAALERCLRLIADTHSITTSAQSLGVTYRALWGRLQMYDEAFGAKLVGKSRGRGTSLTGKGRAVLAALQRHSELFAAPAVERIAALSHDLAQAIGQQSTLRMLASHDYAIARAMSRGGAFAAGGGPELAAAIHWASAGSDECLRALLRGDADLAGYHHLAEAPSESPGQLWQRVEQGDAFWGIALMQREQGLIVSWRMKDKVQRLADLADPDVRFINRQRGSGTRALLDSLLEAARVNATKISGYEQEEFTHQAVAATIAAGAADAGLGLRAAAAQFNLHFIPLAIESYRLAGRIDNQSSPVVKRLISAVRAAATDLPGYKPL
jgi:molybdate transport repressor ModE-like protein